MPVQITDDSIWGGRIDSANRYYDSWARLFKCDVLEKYYEGFQWLNQEQDDNNPYVINKVMETVQIKLDEFIPAQLQFNVYPRMGNSDYNLELAGTSANMKQDVLNTLISEDSAQFNEELRQAYQDSFFRFGLIEVGYSAKWIENPRAQKPLLNSNVKKQMAGMRPKVKFEPKELPADEKVYYKHIAAKRFRVGGFDHRYLDRCSWCGYYEWVYKDDLLALPGLMNRNLLAGVGAERTEFNATDVATERPKDAGLVKIWHIWDNRAQVRIVLLDNPKITLFQRRQSRVNIIDFRHDIRNTTEGFYPVPPVFHWISPQNEINETRQQLRNHRQRFTRKFQVVEEMVDEIELQKFETGADGSLIKVKRENAITAIQDAPLGGSLDKAIVTSSDDLNQISGTASELRGVADRTTATQANIINTKGSIRENAQRDRVAKWFSKIGRETLLTARDKFTIGIWAKLTGDPGEKLFQTVQASKDAYTWVSAEDLNDGYDFKVILDPTTLSAQSQELEKKKFLEFLAVVTQYPQVALSPKLIRECAYRVGYRNEAVIKEMQQMALIQMHAMLQQQQIGGQQPPQPGNMAQHQVAQQTPNGMEQIRQQLTNQQQ